VLGFEADEPLVRQSERGAMYEEALDRLRARGLVYACACTRSHIARAYVGRPFQGRLDGEPERLALRSKDGARAFQASGENTELRYPGTCADRALPDAPGCGLRVRLDPSVERFVDLRHGPQEQRPSEQCGDLLVRDRDGNWTYQFAATVDDYVQGVTLVIRGDDLLASTGRQIQLARLLGRAEPPEFLHHALIMKSPTSAEGYGGQARGAEGDGGQARGAEGDRGQAVKLSKSDRDTGIRELRAAGWTAARVIERALSLAHE